MKNKLQEQFFPEQIKIMVKFFTKTQVMKMLEAITNFRNDSSDWVWKNKVSDVMNEAYNKNKRKKIPSQIRRLYGYLNTTSVDREDAVNVLWNLYKSYPSVKEKWYTN